MTKYSAEGLTLSHLLLTSVVAGVEVLVEVGGGDLITVTGRAGIVVHRQHLVGELRLDMAPAHRSSIAII